VANVNSRDIGISKASSVLINDLLHVDVFTKSEFLAIFQATVRSMALPVNCGVNLVRLFVITV
jgi:hypothetical protein